MIVMPRSTSAARRFAAMLMAFVLAAALLVHASPAAADSAPADPSIPATVTADALPTAQMNGVAWSQVIVGNTVYVGGSFTKARPAGAVAGAQEVTRTHLLAYNLTTGALVDGFSPELNGQVLALAASPDGSRVYAVGDFTQVNGVGLSRAAAFDTATGELIRSWRPILGSQGRGVFATNSTVYLGGNFTTVNGVPRNRIAAVSANDGTVLPFNPNSDSAVNTMVLTRDGSKLIMGGKFGSVGGVTARGLSAVHPTTGAPVAWAAGNTIYASGSDAAFMSLYADDDAVYGTAWAWGKEDGNLEGSFAADPDTGEIVWINDCHGDTYSVYAASDVVYSVGHAHYCGNIGGFPEANPRWYYRAIATTKAATGTVTREPHGYFNFEGQPSPTLLHWYPTLNAGSFTGQNQGPWHITGSGKYIVQAGEFTTVNGTTQQGLVRFATADVAPNKIGPQSNVGLTPTVDSFTTGEVRVSWLATHDRDNENIRYEVTRDGAVVHTVTQASNFWTRPTMTFTDTGLVPGARHLYRVHSYDPAGNTASRAALWVNVADTGESNDYINAVRADSPSSYWPLDEGSGTVAYDYAGPRDLLLGEGVERGAEGVFDESSAIELSGTGTGFGSTQQAAAAPAEFTLEAWVKTTSRRGGKIIGFGNAATGNSGNYDRHVYLDNSGRVWFGVHPGGVRTINTSESFNDGEWHLVTASLGSSGMRLYVDGELLASRADTTTAQDFAGLWRVGGDNLNGWTSRPSSDYLSGSIDEVAVYPRVLDEATIGGRYALGTTGSMPNVAPEAAFTAAMSDLVVSVDASGSSDRDGTVDSYSWDFGDGTTGTGVTATHSFTEPGTYTVTLTVTDDDGATDTASHTVEAKEPSNIPAGTVVDTFSRVRDGGWGTAERGGAWTHVGAATRYSVSEGSGRMNVNAGQTLKAHLPRVTTDDTDLRVTFATDKALTGGGEYLSFIGRRVGDDDYRARVRLLADGGVMLQLQQSGTTLQQVTIPGLRHAADVPLNLRLQVTGTSPTTLQAKVWEASAAEPGAWQVNATSSTVALQREGTLGLEAFVSSSATNAPVVTRFDDLVVTTTDAPPAPGENLAPVAAFTAETSQLSASFDGSGSRDNGGSVTAWAWDFGDGQTGEGPSVTHAYAAPGTYTVTLTVTDDEGATGTITQPVTVAAPPPAGADLAADAFERIVPTGWASADAGGEWSLLGPASNFSVSSGTGSVSTPAGSTRRATLPTAKADSADVRVSFALDTAPTGGGTYVSVIGRQGGTSDLRARVRVLDSGKVLLQVGEGSTVLQSITVPGLTYAVGETLHVRLQVVGSAPTTIQASVWKDGSAEPTAWQVSASSTTAALQRAGSIGLETYTSASTSNGPSVVRFDNLVVGTP